MKVLESDLKAQELNRKRMLQFSMELVFWQSTEGVK